MQYKGVEVTIDVDFMLLLDRWNTGITRGVHGFAVATASDLPYACPGCEHILHIPFEGRYAADMTMLREMLNQFRSKCPGQCDKHRHSTQNGHMESKMLITFRDCCYSRALYERFFHSSRVDLI